MTSNPQSFLVVVVRSTQRLPVVVEKIVANIELGYDGRKKQSKL